MKLSSTSAHADLEYMQEIRSELGGITHALQSLHEVIEHNDDNIGKYIHSYQHGKYPPTNMYGASLYHTLMIFSIQSEGPPGTRG